MTRDPGACLVCGGELHYLDREQEMTCAHCGKTFLSRASCVHGHFICDACHARGSVSVILDHCRRSTLRDPIALVQEIMDEPYIHMHGNEHHIMVGAALITAYRNAGGAVDLDAALEEMCARGESCPGGSCGFWGCCGAAVSCGMFFSIVTKTTPLSGGSWGQANLMTSRALAEIGGLGGPRCCKRNSFTAIRAAAGFVRETLGVELELPEQIRCRWSPENPQCIRRRCPYYEK
ncbi:DUF5714 domain-containing protein [Oscillospiraceae bacterium 50-16]|nr:SAM-dependent methyltransferase [Lawsonibacter sp.]